MEDGRVEVIADLIPPPRSHLFSSESTVGLEEVLGEVLSYLKDERCGTIGLCGIGGIGKTTILKKINNEFGHHFDDVIWVSIGQNAMVERIQDNILRKLQLLEDDHQKVSQDEKASIIYGLLSKKRFLLLLDDVWGRIDLSVIGVPSPGTGTGSSTSQNNFKSKVVFTTRSMDVCRHMEADKMINIKPLSEEQAWMLFSSKVGTNTLNSHTHIFVLAQAIVKECRGLPLALVTLGRSMENKKTPQEWEHVLYNLKYTASNSADLMDLFKVMKLSYDGLRSYTTKKCFIHCSLLPADSPIKKKELVQYWIGEGLLKGFGDQGGVAARNMGYSVLGELVSASLLVEEADSVKMHKLIHDMALGIASDDGSKFFVQAGVHLLKVPKFINWVESEKVSLTDNEIAELDNAIPLCPNLLTLILSKNRFTFISNDFFRSMPGLKVLDLSRSKLEMLPTAIADLLALEYLNLSHTNISHLPKSIWKLVRLKVFDLSYISELVVFPSGVIPHLSSLQTLNMFYCGHKHTDWKDEEEEGDHRGLSIGSRRFLEELESLPLLNDLGLSIRGEPALNKLQTSQKLQGCTRSLSITGCKGLTSFPLSSIQFMEGLDTLDVHNCYDLVEFKIDHLARNQEMEKKIFPDLQYVTIEECWLLEELSWLSFVPKLKSLKIDNCMNLREIVSADHVGGAQELQETSSAFPRLECLYLGYLPELKVISRIALELPMLEEITVIFCPMLKKLIVDGKGSLRRLKMIKGRTEWWDGLEWEDNNTKHAFLPYFAEI